ncbi:MULTISPECIES: hypothetical protein [unclassified Siphonobacter]|uniref:hypothetical protein n=1 Tax=unclassified Siphonobacter TaxID=2635712 RepID=UPI0011402331|nr:MULTISPECIES: hypothetical protein [unclassified Siphonobacter]
MQTFINVTMLAASGEGKTTFLSSMDDNIRRDLASSIGLNLTLDSQLAAQLDQNREKLIASLGKGTITYFDGIQSTDAVSTYPLEISHKNSEPFLVVSFRDIPGNWITDDTEKVVNFIQDSSVIVIPIDSSAVMNDMEECKNNVQNLLDVLKLGLEKNPDTKLVLFIPTKCETYLVNDTLTKDLTLKIHEVYQKIFDFLGLQDNLKSAIIPIQTLGNASFMYHKKVQILNTEVWKPVFSVTQRNQFNPQNIEYPYLYLFSFIFEQYYLKRKKGLMGFFRNLFKELNYLKSTNERLHSRCLNYSNLKVLR